ncbi:YagK/YfjJ domain-containing protein [Pseudomonas marginalis]|uniref:YagK/YfjJ domain-containing protein n=1 Tax=Pseudomonas marginalis TaxID=298 RepID=UPI002A3703D9|nr:inovirus-type Gp2 protein [Pseudomonas marginalis]WPN22975.1 inovirus-type Gp2 protein [Pseudomonas marginalis]
MSNWSPYTSLPQSDIAIQIERLVKSIERFDTPAFWLPGTRSGNERIEPTQLSRYFKYIRQMIDLFDDRCGYQYSEHLQAFWDACQDIGLERSPTGPVCLNESATAYLDHHRSMNVLVERIRQLTGKQWYRRRKGDRRQQARVNAVRVCDYSDAMLARYSRTLIIRVNLYYYQQAQVRLRVERVFDDLDRLLAERERNPIFDHLIGYICAVEQGEDRGYHIHAAFFFNGNEVWADVYKAQQIGELWERITWGQGYSHSCNHDKEKYKDEEEDRLGIGMILRSDQDIRPHIHYAMRYLVKDDQRLQMKPVGARCLRMGRVIT